MTDAPDALDPGSITRLLERINSGEDAARDELFELAYEHLKPIARRRLRGAADRELLQTTAVVNEACLRMTRDGLDVSPKNRGQLFAAVSRAVQWVLADYARRRTAAKRQGDDHQVVTDALRRYEQLAGADFLDLQDALAALRHDHPRAADVIEARFLGGLTFPEIAEMCGWSVDTVKRDWRFGRAFLHARLSDETRD